MALGPRTKIGIAAAVVAAAAGGGWYTWDRWFRVEAQVKAGPGPFVAELEECQRQLGNQMEQVRGRFITRTIWHQGTAAALRIGGVAQVTDHQNRQVRIDYECWAVDGQIVRLGTR